MGHELLWKVRRVLFSRLVQDVVLLSAASPSIYCLFAKSTLIHGTLPSERWCSLDPWGLLGWWHWLKAGPSASWKTRGGIRFFMFFACFCCFQTLAVAWFAWASFEWQLSRVCWRWVSRSPVSSAVRECGRGIALILFRWEVCKKCVREVTRDRVLRDMRIILSTWHSEGSRISAACAMDSWRCGCIVSLFFVVVTPFAARAWIWHMRFSVAGGMNSCWLACVTWELSKRSMKGVSFA